jgi:branched-subunit amino acid transport protein AzlD
MVCLTSCLGAVFFVVSMIYSQNVMERSQVIQQYKKQLPADLQKIYENITKERQQINLYGYGLGVIISLVVILFNYRLKQNKLTTFNTICLVVVISFTTHYFYYMLTPKTTYMLEHIKSPEQTKAWLSMYKTMQYYYHGGLLLGLIAVILLAFAFRC